MYVFGLRQMDFVNNAGTPVEHDAAWLTVGENGLSQPALTIESEERIMSRAM